MKEALQAYRGVTSSKEFQEFERMRSKALHDEAQAIFNAEQRGEQRNRLETAKTALEMGLSIDDVVRLTGLSREEIEKMCEDPS